MGVDKEGEWVQDLVLSYSAAAILVSLETQEVREENTLTVITLDKAGTLVRTCTDSIPADFSGSTSV